MAAVLTPPPSDAVLGVLACGGASVAHPSWKMTRGCSADTAGTRERHAQPAADVSRVETELPELLAQLGLLSTGGSSGSTVRHDKAYWGVLEDVYKLYPRAGQKSCSRETSLDTTISTSSSALSRSDAGSELCRSQRRTTSSAAFCRRLAASPAGRQQRRGCRGHSPSAGPSRSAKKSSTTAVEIATQTETPSQTCVQQLGQHRIIAHGRGRGSGGKVPKTRKVNSLPEEGAAAATQAAAALVPSVPSAAVSPNRVVETPETAAVTVLQQGPPTTPLRRSCAAAEPRKPWKPTGGSAGRSSGGGGNLADADVARSMRVRSQERTPVDGTPPPQQPNALSRTRARSSSKTVDTTRPSNVRRASSSTGRRESRTTCSASCADARGMAGSSRARCGAVVAASAAMAPPAWSSNNDGAVATGYLSSGGIAPSNGAFAEAACRASVPPDYLGGVFHASRGGCRRTSACVAASSSKSHAPAMRQGKSSGAEAKSVVVPAPRCLPRSNVAAATNAASNAVAAANAICIPASDALALDEATLQLERLVEETHRSLVRDGLISLTSEIILPSDDSSIGDTSRGHLLSTDSAHIIDAERIATEARRIAAAENALPMPSLDAVDRALEELQRGLVEIDRALGRPLTSST